MTANSICTICRLQSIAITTWQTITVVQELPHFKPKLDKLLRPLQSVATASCDCFEGKRGKQLTLINFNKA